MRTRTLRGMGPTPPALHACPACHVKEDERAEPIDAAIAVAFGIALVFVRSADGTTASLCPRHLSMVRTLVGEMRAGSQTDPEW